MSFFKDSNFFVDMSTKLNNSTSRCACTARGNYSAAFMMLAKEESLIDFAQVILVVMMLLVT